MGNARWLSILAALLLFCIASPAQQGEKPATAPGQQPREEDKYSEEPFVIEKYSVDVTFAPDGTGRRVVQMRIRVQSEAGVQQLGQLIFGYNSANERLKIDRVQVHKADGSIVTASPDSSQDMTAPIAREAPVYTDYRQVHVTVPGLRPGETLSYSVTTDIHTPLAPGHFWLEYNFEEQVIVLDEFLTVSVPQGRAVKIKTRPGREPAVSENEGRTLYTWQWRNLKRADDDEEVPRRRPKKPEPPAVQLTTFQSWEAVGQWYSTLQGERLAASDEIRARAAELVRNRPGDIEKIEALYDFVAKNFRYVSLSFGVGRYQPHAAAEVFANQYGDCKDKHTLLASLLGAVGMRAFPALVHSSRKVDPEVPSPAQFDHLISVIPLGNSYIWLDTTTEVAPFQLLSINLRDKRALVIPDGEPSRLVETPADPPFPNSQTVDVDGQISELGKLTARVRYVLRGDTELILRLAFRRTPRPQWKQLGQLLATSDGLPGEVTEVKVGDTAATQQPFTLELSLTRSNFLEWTRKKSQLEIPLPNLGLPEGLAEPDKDTEPLEFGSPVEVITRLKLVLPPNYSARAPVPISIARDYAEYRSRYRLEGATLAAERHLKFQKREVPVERSRDYQAFYRAVRSDEDQRLSIESTVAGRPEIPATVKTEELNQAANDALRAGNFSLAVELFQRVVELEPKHKSAWNNLGRAYLAQRKPEPAAEAFRTQIEVNPFDEYAYNNLGRALWQQRKYEEAAAAFEKQIEVSPLDRWAHANLGMLYREWRKYPEAIEALERAVVLDPENAFLQVNLGQAYLNVQDPEKALAAFDRAVELTPSPSVWNNVAYELSLHAIHLDRAAQYAESAVASATAVLRNITLARITPVEIALVSSLAAYWDTLGWVHFQLGNVEKAERYVRAAWLVDYHGEVGDHLAQIHEKLGRKEAAIRTYAQALAATRPVPETRGRLAALVGGDAQVDALLPKASEELNELRSVRLEKLLEDKQSGEADFLILFAPEGPGARVEDVRFLTGAEKLRPFTDALRRAKFPVEFPDATPTKLFRRGTLICHPAAADCIFVLLAADSVPPVE